MREREPDQEREEETDEATKPAGGGGGGEHSDAPGPHGTGEVYPRGDRPEDD